MHNMKNNTDFAKLYIAEMPEVPIKEVYSKERQMYIASATNTKLIRQRYYVWKLLEYALNEILGLKPNEINFEVDKYGKWTCNKCFFSLSHSKNTVAVAISSEPIGLDIENAEHRIHPKLHQKILTEKEKFEYSATPQKNKDIFLLQKWCAKESIFKLCGTKNFKPSAIETDSKPLYIGTVSISRQNFYYSVATNTPKGLEIYTNIILNK